MPGSCGVVTAQAQCSSLQQCRGLLIGGRMGSFKHLDTNLLSWRQMEQLALATVTCTWLRIALAMATPVVSVEQSTIANDNTATGVTSLLVPGTSVVITVLGNQAGMFTTRCV